MMKVFLLTLILLSIFTEASSQDTIDTLALKSDLKLIFDRDQMCRKGSDSSEFVAYIDSTNLIRVEDIIRKYGWPGRSFVGPHGNYTVFLVIQHADLSIQEKYFPMFRKSVEIGESRNTDMAMMQDRILMRKGMKQIFGTQIVFDNEGKNVFYPIEDEANVNTRRASVGLEPIEEYAKHFNIKY